MNTRSQAFIISLAAICFALMFRFEIIGVAAGGEGNQGIAYRLDRWTGEVVYLQGRHGGKTDIKSVPSKD